MKTILKFEGKYNFLSNFFYSDFILDGVTYKTVEHYYQSQKVSNPLDRLKIINCDTPGETKRLGNKVKIISNWNYIKNIIMENGIRAKFTQNKDLTNKLIETDDNYLEESNHWHDNYWGNCHCLNCNNICGENHLGNILMKIRKELKDCKVIVVGNFEEYKNKKSRKEIIEKLVKHAETLKW